MAIEKPPAAADVEVEQIDLKDPVVAVVLAWLVPGLGHWYQGRRSKAVLFFVCILGTFLFGLYVGDGRVVYAAWRPDDRRLPYICQVGAGAVALPALVQARRFDTDDKRFDAEDRVREGKGSIFDWFMVPPQVNPVQNDDRADQLDEIHMRLKRRFELGTVYTMIAGLLNVLAMYDAWGGPAYSGRRGSRRKDDAPPADVK
jgi:hypothetical protein